MFSKIVRRTHMYMALFLTPWVLMYAFSTMAMNHRHLFISIYGEGPPPYQKESEVEYGVVFSEETPANMAAEQILTDLGMMGAHNVRGNLNDGEIVITRNQSMTNKRLTYRPLEKKIIIESEEFRTPTVLERLHRRRGFKQDDGTDDTWGVIVDIFILAMVTWVLSGLWMWWELKPTRKWGAACVAGGIVIFAFFLLVI